MDYLVHVAIVIGIYLILAQSLNLVLGYAGILSLAHAALYGIGAYAAALLSTRLGTPFLVGVLVALAIGGGLGTAIGWLSARLVRSDFILASFAIQVIAFSVINNGGPATGGALGIPNIPRPELLGLKISSHSAYFVLVWVACAGAVAVVRRVAHSPLGRALKAIREDEMVVSAAGKDVAALKRTTFAISGSMAAIAGALYAHYITFIDPTSFTVMESILIVSIVILGGAGSVWGPVLGAGLVVGLPESLRLVGMPSAVAANIRQILYASLLVGFMLWRPQGFLGKYRLGRDRERR